MGLFSKNKPSRVIAGDGMDLNPQLPYDNIGWKVVSDEQDYGSYNNQYKHDAITHRIVYKPASDTTRNGFRIIIPSNASKQKLYQKALDDIKLSQALTQQVIYYYLHGDGYLTVGVKESSATSTDSPLIPQNIDNLTFVHAFGQNHIDKVQSNDDPTSMDYGKEQAIVLRPQSTGYTIDKDGNQVPNAPKLKPAIIDHTRYWHISRDKFEDDETGTSIVSQCQDQIKALQVALETTGKMLREFTFKFYKSDQLMAEGDEDFQRDKRTISQVLNTEAMAFGHSQDSIEKIATPTSGIETLYTFAWQQLCLACGIPKSILIGEQAGTLAGASQDVINYYDNIKSIQVNLLKPEIEQIVRLMMQADGIAGGYDDPDKLDWKIVFNPLQSLDDKTNSEVFTNQANALSTLVSGGIIAPDDAQQMLQGQDTNQNSAMQTSVGDSSDFPSQAEVDRYLQDKKKARHEST